MNLKKKNNAENNNKNDKNKKTTKISMKQIKNGSYSLSITAIFVIIIIVINMIAAELPSKATQIDVSEQKLYSIGKQTEEMLAKLNKEVTIYQVAQSGAEDEAVSKLLQKYEEGSKHVKVEKKDPVVNPKFVSQYTSDKVSPNSVIVVCGERSKVVDYNNIYESTVDYNTYSMQTTGFDGEGQITSAISYVTSDNLPVLYTLEGHGEKDLNSTAKEGIEKGNIQIKSLNLLTEGSVPEDTDCLLINAPANDISSDEKYAIINYLENGGKAMIFSDYTDKSMENFDAVLENYGVKRSEGIVMEGDNQHYALQMPYYLVPNISSTEAAGDAASGKYPVLAPYAQGIQKMENVRNSVTVSSILTTSDSAYSKVNINGSALEKEAGDIEGPFDLGVSIKETLEGGKETKIVYYTTSSLLDDQVNQLVSGGNQQLVMSSLNWMTDSEESTSVSIPSKNLQVSYLTLTDYDASFWKIWTLILIPGAFLVAGFVIWFRRRRA